jgi:hypothetical protein
MIGLAINILWFLIGLIVLLGIVWLALYVVKLFMPIPDKIELAIWCIIFILCLIGALTLLSGSGGNVHFPRLGSVPVIVRLA